MCHHSYHTTTSTLQVRLLGTEDKPACQLNIYWPPPPPDPQANNIQSLLGQATVDHPVRLLQQQGGQYLGQYHDHHQGNEDHFNSSFWHQQAGHVYHPEQKGTATGIAGTVQALVGYLLHVLPHHLGLTSGPSIHGRGLQSLLLGGSSGGHLSLMGQPLFGPEGQESYGAGYGRRMLLPGEGSREDINILVKQVGGW
jgi:hypothetical protein